MNRVLDASVVVKWFAESWNDEENVPEAITLLRAVEDEEIKVVQPAHWKAEVVSVLARRHPGTVSDALLLMEALEIESEDYWERYSLAAKLSIDLNHHLFDTLYHAVALENGAELVTADAKYFNRAKHLGSITLLG